MQSSTVSRRSRPVSTSAFVSEGFEKDRSAVLRRAAQLGLQPAPHLGADFLHPTIVGRGSRRMMFDRIDRRQEARGPLRRKRDGKHRRRDRKELPFRPSLPASPVKPLHPRQPLDRFHGDPGENQRPVTQGETNEIRPPPYARPIRFPVKAKRSAHSLGRYPDHPSLGKQSVAVFTAGNEPAEPALRRAALRGPRWSRRVDSAEANDGRCSRRGRSTLAHGWTAGGGRAASRRFDASPAPHWCRRIRKSW